MTTSWRIADRKMERFEKNITKRGAVPEIASCKEGKRLPCWPCTLSSPKKFVFSPFFYSYVMYRWRYMFFFFFFFFFNYDTLHMTILI
ncbi:hypothetical protein ACP275_04G153200 [Erythranthe tilingii]